VIASKEEYVFRIFDFVAEQECDVFDGLLSSIHVVPQE
jgi:hypothetical protein